MSDRYNNISYGLVRRVEIPRSLHAYLVRELRNFVWRVGSEASNVYHMSTKQATTVVWGPVLFRNLGSQSGCRRYLNVTLGIGDGARVWGHYLPGSPW